MIIYIYIYILYCTLKLIVKTFARVSFEVDLQSLARLCAVTLRSRGQSFARTFARYSSHVFTKLVLEEALRLPKQRKGVLDDFMTLETSASQVPGAHLNLARFARLFLKLCAELSAALRGLLLDLVPQK